MPKRNTTAAILIALMSLMLTPSVAGASDVDPREWYYLLGWVIVSPVLGLVCSLVLYHKTRSVLSWLLFPVWTLVAAVVVFVIMSIVAFVMDKVYYALH